MKNNNPLYVIKGNNVEQAKNYFDLIVKKFNLGPAIEIMTNILKLMLSQVTSYQGFVMVKAWFDELVGKIFGAVTKYGLVKA
jgi:hypothetical protein